MQRCLEEQRALPDERCTERERSRIDAGEEQRVIDDSAPGPEHRQKDRDPSISASLPTEVDEKSVVAELEDGVLTLSLPKREGSGARSIAIQ